MLENKRHLFYF